MLFKKILGFKRNIWKVSTGKFLKVDELIDCYISHENNVKVTRILLKITMYVIEEILMVL